MANVPMNALTRHLAGKVGDMVFRTVDGRVSASLRPRRTNRPPSAGQNEARLRFRKAVVFANSALADPVTRAEYERAKETLRKPLFAIAVGDYFNPPAIDEIDLSGYDGHAGKKIAIMAHDDVAVVSLGVAIKSGVGAVIEQGAAVFDKGKWVYTATTTLAAGATVTIEGQETGSCRGSRIQSHPPRILLMRPAVKAGQIVAECSGGAEVQVDGEPALARVSFCQLPA